MLLFDYKIIANAFLRVMDMVPLLMFDVFVSALILINNNYQYKVETMIFFFSAFFVESVVQTTDGLSTTSESPGSTRVISTVLVLTFF